MADSESDLETDRLELALDNLFVRQCGDESSQKSKLYCSEFCKLVEEHTGRWQVPLPQLKVLRTALCSFTKATAAFPADCQHIHYTLSSLALSFFELMLFFSKEEFVEDPLKDILDTLQECHSRLLRHRNAYLEQVKHVIKVGGPWENPVLQGIMSEAAQAQDEVEEYLSAEAPVFLELRVRYLLACERVREATALSKCCLENRDARRHLYFRQAYLTCLYKASLHEHLHKEMAEIDGRDAVEILCNTESAEKDELLLSLCKAFLTQQLQNGDMYYIWDLLFIWSKLHLRAHPCRKGFLDECCQLSTSATNIRSIFPFIKVITAELGSEGVPFCVELCARALQVCGLQADGVIHSVVCKTIAFLLSNDLEVCRACALLVFCQERSLEAYRAVCLLYTHPDEEPHPHSSPVRTNIRFQLLQLLKERLYFDPEFWNLLTIRTHCLEMISDKAMKAAVLIEMEEEEKCHKEIIPTNHTDAALPLDTIPCIDPAPKAQDRPEEQAVKNEAERVQDDSAEYPSENTVKRRRMRRRRRIIVSWSDEELDPRDDDPEYKYNLKPTYTDDNPKYSLRQKKATSVRQPSSRQREYLSRCVKNHILKRKGRKKLWLQGLPRPEQVQVQVQVQVVKRPRGRPKGSGKQIGQRQKLELTYPDNEEVLYTDELAYEAKSHTEENGLQRSPAEQISDGGQGLGHHVEGVDCNSRAEPHTEDCPGQSDSKPCKGVLNLAPLAEGDVELDGPAVLVGNAVEFFHNYSFTSTEADSEKLLAPDSTEPTNKLQNYDEEQEPSVETSQNSYAQVKVNLTWKERTLRHKQSGHLRHRCASCQKDFKGLNVVRHAFSHLKRKKLKCIFCGKRFKLLLLAKKHVRDHIDEMCKEPAATVTEVVNGVEAAPENDQGEIQPRTKRKYKLKQTSDGLAPTQKSVCKKPVLSLSREDRIIRNVRVLIKKTCLLQRKQNKLDHNAGGELETEQQQWESFKDEQVIIKDGMVAVSDLPVSGEQEGTEGEEKQAQENGHRVEYMFHLCPSESCDKVFKKIDSALIKHTFNFHIKEESVLEKTFVWTKHKCPICLRTLQFLQHFKDHMTRHDAAKRFFCYHLDCDQRFQTHPELKTHIRTHQPFRPRCPYTDCRQLFCSLQTMYDHEWRHYVPVPQKEDLDVLASRQKRQSSEASWKQRVKIEELWLQKENKVHPQEFSRPNPRGPADHDTESDCGPDPTPETTDTSDPNNVHDSLINGHEVGTIAQFSGGELPTSSSVGEKQDRKRDRKRDKKPEKKPERMSAYKGDYIDVKDMEDTTMTREGIHQSLGDPLITEHPKTFKTDDPSYAPLIKCTFNRIPPSAYLDESALSMRKRKSTDEIPPQIQKYLPWSKMKKLIAEKKNEPTVDNSKGGEEVVTRRRCTKCLSSFSSQEELEKHQSLNTCSSLFGFDSDDESKHVGLTRSSSPQNTTLYDTQHFLLAVRGGKDILETEVLRIRTLDLKYASLVFTLN